MPENANKSHTHTSLRGLLRFPTLHLSAASLIILYLRCAIAYLEPGKRGKAVESRWKTRENRKVNDANKQMSYALRICRGETAARTLFLSTSKMSLGKDVLCFLSPGPPGTHICSIHVIRFERTFAHIP